MDTGVIEFPLDIPPLRYVPVFPGGRVDPAFPWSRSEVFVLAARDCGHCKGTGISNRTKHPMRPCNCVLRAIFRACYSRYRACSTKEKFMSRWTAPGLQRMVFARLDEDYVCDFDLISRRTLTRFEFAAFRRRFLERSNWRVCCTALQIDRDHFNDIVKRIEQKLGRVFRELQPYGLFPLHEYFAGKINRGAR